MAFCTSCGAQVTGAFCNQCGTPAGHPAATPASSAPQAPPPPPAQAVWTTPAAAPAAPPTRKTSPLIWVLVIVLGLFVLGGIAVVGAGIFVVHKARQAGLDPELLRSNPGLAVSKMVAAANPDVEVLKTDDSAGTITLRNRKDGKVITLSFDQIKGGNFSMRAFDESGKAATVEFGGNAKLPSWVPEYPGSKPVATFAAKGDSADEQGEAGNFSFTTADSPAKVISYYQDKLHELGMKAEFTAGAATGGMIVAADDDGTRSMQVVVGNGENQTTVNVTYGRKR
jgi:nitrate reductase NapE component